MVDVSRAKVRRCESKLRYWGGYIRSLVRDYGLVNFVETGTGIGEGVAFAVTLPFKRVWSCDIEPSQIAFAQAIYPETKTDERVRFFPWSSVTLFERRLADIPLTEPILFWLDAHFPGTYYGRKGFDAEDDGDVRLPLNRELKLIHKIRARAKLDAILIDDLWFLADGPYQWGNLPDDLARLCPAERGIGFIQEMFGATHAIEAHTEYSGWLSIIPRIA